MSQEQDMVGIYKGRTLVKEEAGKWSLYNIVVIAKNYEHKLSCFNSLKNEGTLQLAELKEGETYLFQYIQREVTKADGKKFTSRTVSRIIPSMSPGTPPHIENKQRGMPADSSDRHVPGDAFYLERETKIEEKILIGQSINLAMIYFQMTNQGDKFTQENFNTISLEMLYKLQKTKEHLRLALHPVDAKKEAEIQSVKDKIAEMGGMATIGQLEHCFGVPTTQMIVEHDGFRVDGDKVIVR